MESRPFKKPRRSSILKTVNPNSQEQVVDNDATATTTTTRYERRVSFAEVKFVKNFDVEDGQCHTPKQEPALVDSSNSVGSHSHIEQSVQSSSHMSVVQKSHNEDVLLQTQNMSMSRTESTNIETVKRSRISMAALHDSVIAAPNMNEGDVADHTVNILEFAAQSTPKDDGFRPPLRQADAVATDNTDIAAQNDNFRVPADNESVEMSVDSQMDFEKSVNVKNLWQNTIVQDEDMEITEPIQDVLYEDTMLANQTCGPDKTVNFLDQLKAAGSMKYSLVEESDISLARDNANRTELKEKSVMSGGDSLLLEHTNNRTEAMVISQPDSTRVASQQEKTTYEPEQMVFSQPDSTRVPSQQEKTTYEPEQMVFSQPDSVESTTQREQTTHEHESMVFSQPVNENGDLQQEKTTHDVEPMVFSQPECTDDEKTKHDVEQMVMSQGDSNSQEEKTVHDNAEMDTDSSADGTTSQSSQDATTAPSSGSEDQSESDAETGDENVDSSRHTVEQEGDTVGGLTSGLVDESVNMEADMSCTVQDTVTPGRKHIVHEEDVHVDVHVHKKQVLDNAGQNTDERTETIADLRKKMRRSMEMSYRNSPRRKDGNEMGIMDEMSMLLVNRTETLTGLAESVSLPKYSSPDTSHVVAKGDTVDETKDATMNLTVTGSLNISLVANQLKEDSFFSEMTEVALFRQIQSSNKIVEQSRKDILKAARAKLQQANDSLCAAVQVRIEQLKKADQALAKKFLEGKLKNQNQEYSNLWEVSRHDSAKQMVNFQTSLTKQLADNIKEIASEIKAQKDEAKRDNALIEQLPKLREEADRIPQNIGKKDFIDFARSKDTKKRLMKECDEQRRKNRKMKIELEKKAVEVTRLELKQAECSLDTVQSMCDDMKKNSLDSHTKYAPFTLHGEASLKPVLECCSIKWKIGYSKDGTLKSIKPEYIKGGLSSSALLDSKRSALVQMINRADGHALKMLLEKYRKKGHFVELCQELVIVACAVEQFCEQEIVAACRADPTVSVDDVSPLKLCFRLHYCKMEVDDCFVAEVQVQVVFLNLHMQYALKLVEFRVTEGHCVVSEAHLEKVMARSLKKARPLLHFIEKVEKLFL